MELIGQFCAYLERMGYMERDSLRDLLYCLARLGLFWFINFFGVIMGKTVILGVIGSFVPRLHLYDSPEALSLISFFIPVIFILILFADDAKRHTAYGRYNPVLVSSAMILIGASYYLPCLAVGYIKDIKNAEILKGFYFINYWASEIVGDEVELYNLVGTLALVLLSIFTYLIARRIYLKKFESGEYEYEY